MGRLGIRGDLSRWSAKGDDIGDGGRVVGLT